ncbi:hypothetical protein F1643_04540 [Azospirillum sp. INR13]|nr:hypothetical protein [Azospirillum sp. INR13]
MTAVWLYHRYPLSLRMVEEILAARASRQASRARKNEHIRAFFPRCGLRMGVLTPVFIRIERLFALCGSRNRHSGGFRA